MRELVIDGAKAPGRKLRPSPRAGLGTIGGRIALACASSALAVSAADAREFSAAGVPANIVAKAISPLVKFPIRACSTQPVSGAANINTVADAAEFFTKAGLPVGFRGQVLEVGCDAADAAVPTTAIVGADNIPAGSPLGPFGASAPVPQQPAQAAPVPRPDPVVYERVSAKWVKRPLLDKIGAAVGLKMVFDDTPEHPILLAGPADAVQIAKEYIAAVNVCPVQLAMEASVINRSDSALKNRDAGIRLGGRTIGFGTPGTTNGTGIAFPWLTAFLEATKEDAQFRVNASHTALLLPGELATLRDGGEAPVRGATSVTDRETRVDVLYRNTGFNLDVTLLAIDGGEALVAFDQSYTSVGTVTDLGPSFSNRAVKAVMRVPIGEPVVMAVSGADSISTSKRRGLLHWGDTSTIAKGGSFLVFRLKPEGCREREPASANDTPARLGRKRGTDKLRVGDDGA